MPHNVASLLGLFSAAFRGAVVCGKGHQATILLCAGAVLGTGSGNKHDLGRDMNPCALALPGEGEGESGGGAAAGTDSQAGSHGD